MYHKIRQGEHLSGIARLYGFHDYETIWRHPENAKLRKRTSPNILLPGDSLFIPEKTAKSLSRNTDSRHSFRLSTRPLSLRIVLERQFEKPVAGAPCELLMDLDRTPLVTSGEGELDQPIRAFDVEATLSVRETAEGHGGTVTADWELPLRIGYLDPIDEPSGWLGRLANLEYYRSPVNAEPDADELLSAVEEFQCDNHLAVDGVCGPQTQAKLKSVYGC
ncbi:MAG: peptidoglycan-binding domain-containing protein [Bryobacteraceae bacterium]